MDQAHERIDSLESLSEDKYFSPVHPKYFMRLSGCLLFASFLIFSSFLM